jgi:membrane protein DedA with SNARE-associated domain
VAVFCIDDGIMALSIISGNYVLNLGIIFIWNFLGSLGAPGGMVLLLSSGALADNLFELATVMAIGVVSSILGDLVAYEAARKFSTYVSSRLANFKSFREGELKVRMVFEKSAYPLIFVTRFAILSLCTVVSYISGFEKLKRKKFYIAMISGEILYGVSYPLIGYVFKESRGDILVLIINATAILLLMAAVFFYARRLDPARAHKKDKKGQRGRKQERNNK